MSYLDNLENSLKALEGQEERDPAAAQRRSEARARERDAAVKRGPHVRALQSSAFTGQLLGACRQLGPKLGMYVNVVWVDGALRLEARDQRLELAPTAEGIDAVYFADGEEQKREPVDLDGDGAALAKTWMESIPS
jgi:hypothetical protein